MERAIDHHQTSLPPSAAPHKLGPLLPPLKTGRASVIFRPVFCYALIAVRSAELQ